MRPLRVIALFAALVALAGCGSSPGTSAPDNPFGPPTLEDLKKTAEGFQHAAQSNTQTSGDKVPLKFLDTAGKPVDVAAYRGKANVVLVVVKGFPNHHSGQFCPGCLAQVHALTANYDEFKKREAEVLVVFPGPTDKLPKFLADAKVDGADGNPRIPFPLLSDTDLKAVEALGIRDVQARPSTYILNKKGDVVFAYVGPPGTTYDRPSVKALLGELDKLNGKK